MEFHTLGALEVSCEGTPVPITGTRRRALLAILLVYPGQVVPMDVLIDALWPTGLPANPEASIRFHIWKLRQTLDQHDPHHEEQPSSIRCAASSYKIPLESNLFDNLELATAVESARAVIGTEPSAALATLQDALGRWRGFPFEELRYVEYAQATIHRLRELHLEAQLLSSESLLGLGRHREAVPTLEGLVAEHPLTEPLWTLLLTAMWRCGRPADALVQYNRMETKLENEMGMKPSRELQQLKQRLLVDQPV
ncbi:MAG: hypothetical protein HKN07_03685 [Acidimicrobiia bacterium]|nr:hypothetical protein [Acidimicrobiia bacterium]